MKEAAHPMSKAGVPVSDAAVVLVEPVAELTAQQQRRYARQLLLPGIGELGQRRLLASSVLVVGAGGLGSPVLLYLAAAGVGTIGIVDDDRVDISNLQRQVVHASADEGRSKTGSAAARIRALNPEVTVVEHDVRLTAANAAQVIGGYDVVVDGSDTFETRYLVSDTCEALGKAEVWGSVLRFDGQVGVFWSPHGPTYRDLHPEPPPDGAVPSCADVGVSGALCGTIGSLMAGEVLKLVTGHGRPLIGRVLIHDALGGSFRELRVRPDPRRPRVAVSTTGKPGSQQPRIEQPRIEQPRIEQPRTAAVSVTELDRLTRTERVLVVDVRDAAEAAAFRLPQAIAVPLEDFADPDVVERLVERADGRRLVTVCPAGRRSAAAARVLRAAGADDAVHLEGGLRAWLEHSGEH
jgi:molybdopterin/thiamine biosynthesis adenylyltransferase/rhodanese-related sulfurtransferase